MDPTTWATYLLQAERDRHAVAPVTDTVPDLTVDDAYRIQEDLIRQRLASGERSLGTKLGLTSRAKQEAVGVREPIYGQLTDAMLAEEGTVGLGALIHPRVEPEIVFVLDRDLAGPGVTPPAALAAVGAVLGGLEVIDSRYRDFRFELADVVADNASSSRVVLGPRSRRDPDGFDLATVGCVLLHNGEAVGHASGAAVLGHPVTALALLANMLGRSGGHLPAGSVVLTGGLTDAVPVGPGDHVEARFGADLGSATLHAVAS